MTPKNWRFVVTGMCLLSACGDSAEGPDFAPLTDSAVQGPLADAGGTGQGDAGAPSTDAAGSGQAEAGAPASTDAAQPAQNTDASQPTEAGPSNNPSGDAGSDTGTGPALPYDYKMQNVDLTADLVIPKGKTVRVGPGTTFSGKSANVKIDVQGELVIEGAQASPATFQGTGAQESWRGIQVSAGGKLTISQAKISGARYGIHALPGSSYSIDRTTFDTSFKAAVLQSSGTVSNSTFKAVFLLPAITNEVTIDDPNGALTIMDASPTVTNSRFEGSGGLNDMIRIGGNATPTFDHIFVTNSHCGFHISGGNNNAPKITNSVFDKLSYGIMAYASQVNVSDSVFTNNGSDVGMCTGATEANVPKLNNNAYTDNALRVDASCDRIGTKDAAPAKTPNPSAGAKL
jgi:hypothetical protein